MVRTNEAINIQWNNIFGGEYEGARSLVATSDGGYSLAGYTQSLGAGGNDFWLVKTDELGLHPEYSSFSILEFVLTATAFITVSKNQLFHERS